MEALALSLFKPRGYLSLVPSGRRMLGNILNPAGCCFVDGGKNAPCRWLGPWIGKCVTPALCKLHHVLSKLKLRLLYGFGRQLAK